MGTDRDGWQNYQELVLTELKRHESKYGELSNELTNLRLSNTRMEVEMKNISVQLHRLLNELNSLEDMFSDKVEDMSVDKQDMKDDLSAVKWKLSAFVACTGTILTFIANALIKFFLP